MTTVTDFPNPIREIRHCEITLPDGCRLAARIWLPVDAEDHPVPAIFEFLPYRKNDMTAARDKRVAPYLAGHGYAFVRVDLRGAGDSDGVMPDEYTAQEHQDGCDVIAWIADQPWCDGNVGITGISWSGFNGLAIAARRPPALKAVVTMCASDDRYADDVHYTGGCVSGEQLIWSSVMFAKNTLPPDPANVGDRWREMWLDRLRGSGLWLKTWMEHQRRDAYWKHGSVCEDYAQINIPVFAVSGWVDGYYPAVFRLMEHLDAPCKGVIGPWSHAFPNLGRPGPTIGFLQELVRWWDHWLKGKDTGIMDEPALQLYVQHSSDPNDVVAHRDGHWVAEPSWPSGSATPTAWHPDIGGSLIRGQMGGGTVTHASPMRAGGSAGTWCPYARAGDMAGDQRADDAFSLCFDSPALEDAVEIVGQPVVRLAFEVDRPLAQVAIRLTDVAPDGAATRVTYAVLNLTHRDSHENPEPLEPGQLYECNIPLRAIAHRFSAGNRIRLAVSTCYFPFVWPSPERVEMKLHLDKCALRLPERAARPLDARMPDWGPPEHARPLEIEEITPPRAGRRIGYDVQSDLVEIETHDGDGRFRIVENDLTVFTQGREVFVAKGRDPAGTSGRTFWEYEMSRGDWSVRTETEVEMVSSQTHWEIQARLRAWEGDDLVHQQSWEERIQRDMC